MLYFELQRSTRSAFAAKGDKVPPGYYSRDMDLPDGELPPGIISYTATRIWKEQDGKIELIKCRTGEFKVDMKEFAWIKLKAQALRVTY